MYGDVWILVLNSHADLFPTNNPDFPGQYEYIAEELQSDVAQNAAFRLVAFHQAPYSNSSTSSTPDQIYGNAGIREFWVPLFERFDVDSVISGHYHSYQRGELNGIQYLITGGGGSTLLQQQFDVWDWLSLNLTYQYTLMIREGNELRWETYDLDENLIDKLDDDSIENPLWLPLFQYAEEVTTEYVVDSFLRPSSLQHILNQHRKLVNRFEIRRS